MGATSIDIVRAVQSKTLPSSFKANLTDDLRSACYSGNFEECYHIVHDKSCDVNDRADGKGSWRPGATPLHIAAARGHTSIISVLLEFRADTSIKDKAAEIPLHVACCAGHTNAVQMLLEAERAKPVHVRKSELNHDKPRVRARDLTNKGRFRLPATFAMASTTMRQAVASGQSSLSIMHEGMDAGSTTRITDMKLSILGNQFIDFEVANFGGRHARINDQMLVFADPPFGEVPLNNAAQCSGCLVAIKRGGHVRFVTKALHAQDAGAIAVVMINDEDQPLVPHSSGGTDDDTEHVVIPVIGVSRKDGRVLRHNLKRDANANVDLSFSVRKQNVNDEAEEEGEVERADSSEDDSDPMLIESMPYVQVPRSELMRKSLWHFDKTIVVESHLTRRLLSDAAGRKEVLGQCLERCLELVASVGRGVL